MSLLLIDWPCDCYAPEWCMGVHGPEAAALAACRDPRLWDGEAPPSEAVYDRLVNAAVSHRLELVLEQVAVPDAPDYTEAWPETDPDAYEAGPQAGDDPDWCFGCESPRVYLGVECGCRPDDPYLTGGVTFPEDRIFD